MMSQKGSIGNPEVLQDENQEDSQNESEDSNEDAYFPSNIDEPNKFDGLCDGLWTAMAYLHNTFDELLELKDRLLYHLLPPNLLASIALVIGKLCRSIADLNSPVNEIIRLVRLYSASWEQRSFALKKLHEDFECMKRQLGIAVKRLQLAESHSKRLAKEKRVLNWERTFAKVMGAKCHSRRWKFLIEPVKAKANLGMEHLYDYIKTLDKSENKSYKTSANNEIPSVIQEDTDNKDRYENNEDSSTQDNVEDTFRVHEDGTVKSKKDDDLKQQMQESCGISLEDGQSLGISPVKECSTSNPAGPETVEKAVWTEEPEYDCHLHLQVFGPQDFTGSCFSFTMNYGDLKYRSGIMVSPYRGKVQKIGSEPNENHETEKDKENTNKEQNIFEEIVLPISRQSLCSNSKSNQLSDHPDLTVAIYEGLLDNPVGMAAIDLQNVEEKDFPTIILPKSSLPVSLDTSHLATPLNGVLPAEKNDGVVSVETVRTANEFDFLLFPVYSIKTGKMNMMKPCASLPVRFFWGKTLKQKHMDAQTETMSLHDLVFDLTGINQEVTGKQDLMKETTEQATRANVFTPDLVTSFTPETKDDSLQVEDVITRSHYQQLLAKHNEELLFMQEYYEKQLQEMMEKFKNLQNLQKPICSQRPLTSKSCIDLFTTERKPDVNQKEKRPKETRKSKERKRTAHNSSKWEEKLPQDFFERMKLFAMESSRRKQEMCEKIAKEMSKTYERRLAGQWKLDRYRSKDNSLLQNLSEGVSLPAVFMPFQSGSVFNPRAYQYFRPSGSCEARITQPPSMFQVPPLPSQVSF